MNDITSSAEAGKARWDIAILDDMLARLQLDQKTLERLADSLPLDNHLESAISDIASAADSLSRQRRDMKVVLDDWDNRQAMRDERSERTVAA